MSASLLPHTSHSIFSSHHHHHLPHKWSPPFILLHPFDKPPSHFSSSTLPQQTTSMNEDQDVSAENPESNTPFSGCKACGREEVEKGCNGEGRIQGGIATVPGFGWWPIKAYRPCPGFVASGGRYRRWGQSMDEVASGGRQPQPAVVTTNEKKD